MKILVFGAGVLATLYAARGEMQHLATEFRSLIAAAAVPAPVWDSLARYLDPDTLTLPEGSAQLPLRWGRTAAAFGLLSALFLLTYRITVGRSSSRTIRFGPLDRCGRPSKSLY